MWPLPALLLVWQLERCYQTWYTVCCARLLAGLSARCEPHPCTCQRQQTSGHRLMELRVLSPHLALYNWNWVRVVWLVSVASKSHWCFQLSLDVSNAFSEQMMPHCCCPLDTVFSSVGRRLAVFFQNQSQLCNSYLATALRPLGTGWPCAVLVGFHVLMFTFKLQ